MKVFKFFVVVVIPVFLCSWGVVSCSSNGRKAPVIDRSSPAHSASALEPGAPVNSVQTLPGLGNYMVKKGDTLFSIALETGNDWHDLVTWNNLENPNRLLVGQILRTSASSEQLADHTVVQTQPVTAGGAVEVRSIDSLPSAKPYSKPEVRPDIKTEFKPDLKTESPLDNTMSWVWPLPGAVIEIFSEGKNKGIDIAAKSGEPVLAVAQGRVVYAGNALRAYGQLIIIKHNTLFLSVYAHNKILLVKEGDTVQQSQKIAEAGSTDTDKSKLHFEIRKQGQPVDPLFYLPPRR